MVHGTAVVWLPVTDISRSLAFYRDTLSLEEVHRQAENWAELDANGLHIGFELRRGSSQGDGGAVIAFQPQDGLDATVAQLRDRGSRDRRRDQRAPVQGVASPRSRTRTATTSSCSPPSK